MTKSTSRRRSPRHLSDTALVVLGRAADRDDQMLLPIPKAVTARGGALQRVFRGLLDQGLVKEVPVGLQDEAWRVDDEGRYGLRITAAGLRAIGVPALESGLDRGKEPKSTRGRIAGRPGTKQARLIELLSEPSGQTIDDLTGALGWLPHTVRAAITGLRKSGHAVVRAKNDAGQTVYRIEGGGAAVAAKVPADPA